MQKVELSDGTIINAELNGNNYIPKILDKNIFTGNLDKITITDENGNVEELYNQKVQFARIKDKDTFILSEKSKDEIEKETLYQLLADLTETLLLGGI